MAVAMPAANPSLIDSVSRMRTAALEKCAEGKPLVETLPKNVRRTSSEGDTEGLSLGNKVGLTEGDAELSQQVIYMPSTIGQHCVKSGNPRNAHRG